MIGFDNSTPPIELLKSTDLYADEAYLKAARVRDAAATAKEAVNRETMVGSIVFPPALPATPPGPNRFVISHTLNANNNRYHGITAANFNWDLCAVIVPVDCVMDRIDMRVAVAAGVGNTHTFELWKNVAFTGERILVTDDNTTATLLLSEPFVAGDEYAIVYRPAFVVGLLNFVTRFTV